MKKIALLNGRLSYEIACLGHGDSLTICDAGLPINKDTTRIDLALSAGIPSFLQTLEAVGSEMYIERAVLAVEIKTQNPALYATIIEWLEKMSELQNNQIKIDHVLHDSFKKLANQSKAIVRTGEFTPFANVILFSGVPF